MGVIEAKEKSCRKEGPERSTVQNAKDSQAVNLR